MKLVGEGPVVLVDDDEVDVEILTRSFARSSLADTYDFRAFSDGEEFLEYMRLAEREGAHVPSIVLLDINMPQMDGFEVLERLRAIEKFREVPTVMFVSNSDNPRDIERCAALNAGFQEKFDSMADCVAFYNSLAS